MELLKRESHRLPPPKGEPECTKSQIVYYVTADDITVAVVHQYMRPDGSIGASGKPDPKWLYYEGHEYKIRRST